MKVLTNGNRLSLTSATAINAIIPRSIYDLNYDPDRGEFFLHKRAAFRMPDKIYGGHDTFADRALRTYAAFEGRGMAVLLSGPKGSGKTLTAKRIATDSGLPVIVMTAAYLGPQFLSFLSEIPCQAVVFIDEFEKLYDKEEQRLEFLTILDGAADNRHLFVLTSNEAKIGQYFDNRPGRIRYHRRYEELPPEILVEMIHDKVPKEKRKLRTALIEFVQEIGQINPDALTELIHECLIHDEVPKDFISFFNVQDEIRGSYDVEIFTSGYRLKPVPKGGKKLTQAQIGSAHRFISSVNSDGEGYADMYYGEGRKFCQEVNQVWRANYVEPFTAKPDRKSKHNQEFFVATWCRIENAEEDSPHRTFRFNTDQLLSFKREHGKIVMELKQHTQKVKIICTPSRSYKNGAY